MAVNMSDVKTLRNKTGAGFADCKNALEKSNNDIDAAIKLLKEMGMAAAEKRAGRATSEGSLFVGASGNKAVLLELNCETDFVARNDEFQKLGNDLIQEVLTSNATDITDSMKEKVQNVIATIKENMEIKRFQVVEKSDDEIFATYAHGVPARLATAVVVKAGSADVMQKEEFTKFANNCALHAVARTPLFLSPDSITAEYNKEQMEIITKQVEQLGKPPNVMESIIKGKWSKHANEISFTTQPWVHDEQSTAEKEIKNISKELGTEIQITNFAVYILGSE